jgi:hypothetical protein
MHDSILSSFLLRHPGSVRTSPDDERAVRARYEGILAQWLTETHYDDRVLGCALLSSWLRVPGEARMDLLGEVLTHLAVGSLGIFTGAMLTEGLVLVPYWRSLPAEAFYSWYGTNDKRLVAFFGPLTWLAALSALSAAAICLWTAHPGRWYSVGAAVCALAVVSMFFVYFERANAAFSLGRMPADELRAELDRWAAWHSVRSGVSLAALTAAIMAVWP